MADTGRAMFATILGVLLLFASGAAAIISLAAVILDFHRVSSAFASAAVTLFGAGVLLIVI